MSFVQLRDLLPQALNQKSLFQPVADDQEKLVVNPRLFDILEKSYLIDCPNGAFFVCVTGQQYACGLRLQGSYLSQEFNPFHMGHQIVCNNQIQAILPHVIQSLTWIGVGVDVVVVLKFQKGPNTGEYHLFVIHDK